ncbi:MAG: GDP-mannose 4,6-dehydratase [Actinomycetes bacterium]
MRVVIAGGAGFLGSHLADLHVARGDDVVILDDFSTGTAENVSHLAETGGVEIIEADVSHDVPVSGPVGRVYNLASPASPPAYLERPLETLAVGSEGTRLLLELADAHGARFVMASTSEIYGDPEVHPQVESYRGNVDPHGPRSVYDEAKRFSESITMAYHRARGTDIGIARIFNTYGPRLSAGDGRVVSNFIVQALTGEPLTIYGDGSQTRSLCFVADLVAGLMALGDATTLGPVNLGNPDERSVAEIADAIVMLTGSSSSLIHMPLPTDDPTRRCPDITRAKSELGWEPAVSTNDGLVITIDHFRRVLGL